MSENITEQIQIPLAELIKIRRDKVLAMKEKGIDSYPYKYEYSYKIKELFENFDELSENETAVKITGRVMLKRKMGKTFFANLRDSSEQIQIYVRKDALGDDLFDLFNSIDLGDIIGCEGTLFITKMGEKTVRVSNFTLLTKTLHPLPDKHAGLTDIEQRYRRRYADLIVNPEVRKIFIMRTKIIQAIRNYLNAQDFLEVETPILQPMYGGALARPFVTHHNTLDIPMYLRIADELYLKRLIVGGYEKVWELCKDFRNEGMDRLHNPEFTMIELYWAFADYKDIGNMFEDLIRTVVYEIHGKYKIQVGEHEIDFEKPFTWLPMLDSIKEKTGVDFNELSYDDAKAKVKELKLGIDTDKLINWGKVIEAVWEVTVEPTLIQPTFVCDFPVEISPFAKKHRSKTGLTERFELFIATNETGNAFSELNDPIDQLERFMQQREAIEAGDEEAQPLDDDFITALTYGMPPTGGLGFGVDRLVMMLTNQTTLRDIIFFPQMKEAKEGTVPVSKILAQIIDEEKR